MSAKFSIKTICFALALVLAPVQASAAAEKKSISFEADNVIVNQTNGSLVATGNVDLRQAGITLSR